ncbi:DUF2868 domain-containing protein [Marinomonas sp. M1K-6]|uniref:DUF2868 domain-containing protein n=1 Tax=Marinomonas profundi TaxID=2726122 RepID=A0A847R4F8_9GAMM|nr:DUF2868 domain-containing protein [Marinomonas profundi]NLQ18871.1 DUF2868 domain-containing protein [Marinomonas profundi]UDV01798.1 DUF2868 domain-containing protein [Marinomonas profundi]
MTFPTQGAKLALAAWLESHSAFRLPTEANNLSDALKALETTPHLNGYLTQFSRLRRYFIRAILSLFVVSFLLGMIAVPPAFATGESHQVNIFWLFIILLGFHALNFVVWFITMLATMRQQTSGQGLLLSLLIFINKKISKHSHIEEEVAAAYFHWQCPTHANKWLVSSISHGAWGCYLFAGWMMTLLLLLTNQVNFVWETTLLSDNAFIQLTQTLSVIPQWFGISLPNQLDILASRVDLVSQTAATRQHWANFLLASIMLYGVLPRLILTAICLGLYHVKRATQPLSTPEKIIQNRYRQQAKQSRHILDADHHPASHSATNANNASNGPLPSNALSQHWALYEWSQAKPDSLRQPRSLSLLNNRQQQDDFLASPSDEAMYILVDAKQSPDRGTRRFFSQASTTYPALFMVIYGGENATFSEDWQRLARETHLPFTPFT